MARFGEFDPNLEKSKNVGIFFWGGHVLDKEASVDPKYGGPWGTLCLRDF